ncbi:MAG: DUF3413 domain-containing protein [Opitutales bacterium]|nr:DUF3413 domain-containing protein [Opitutales bacterium]
MEGTQSPENRSRGNAVKTSAYFYGFLTVVCALISLNYFPMLGIDFSDEGWIFALCSMFGHFWMLALFAWLLLAFPLALLVPARRKILAGLSIVVGIFAMTLLTADTIVFGIYRFHIYNPFVLDLLLGGDAGGIFVFSAGQYALASGLFALIVAGTAFLWFLASKAGKYRCLPLCVYAGFSFLFLLSANFMHAYYSAVNSRSVSRIAEVYPFYFPLTANRFLINRGWVDPEKVREKVKVQAGGTFFYPQHPLAGTPSGKNILFILIDSWNIRSFKPEVMPTICDFARNAQVFEEHYSGDHGTRTGVISLFAGLPGLYFNTLRGTGTPAALVDFATKNDYRPRLLATARLSNPPFTQTIFSCVPGDAISDSFHDDKKTVDAWLDWTRERAQIPAEKRRPFFGLVFLDQLHNMHLPDDAQKIFPSTWDGPHYESLSASTDAENFFNLYKNNAFWVDRQVARILNDLKERGWLEDTIVILTGDHGQEFNEEGNNIYGHGSMFSTYQLHVPFILFDATLPPKRYNHWSAHYDVSVTLLQNYFDCKNPPSDYSIGKNLFDTSSRRWLLVGHPENFAVLEEDRTTHVKFDRSYVIYDRNSRELKDARIRADIFQKALKESQHFYEKP